MLNPEVIMRIPKSILWLAIFLLLPNLYAYSQKLPTAKPEDMGFSQKHLDQLNPLIEKAIANKDFPGAVLLVARKGKVVLRRVYGDCQWIPDQRSMQADMIFDLASITKPVATASCVMKLVENGQIRLLDKVKNFVPGFTVYEDSNGVKGQDARLWHLLTHTSGLLPYTNATKVEAKYGSPCPTDSLVSHIAGLRKINAPGEAFHYSCLGFITLAHIVKQVSGKSVAEFARDNFFKPLGMKDTFYTPSEKYFPRCVPTEVIDGQPLIGIVHDPLARLQGGISGNAGLFSTVDDLAIFAQMMLNEGEYAGIRVLSPLTVQRMTSVFSNAGFSGRGLGWDLNSAYSSNGGDLFGPNSYGHSGYTGTSIWIDPDTETAVIFLTNRVHPSDGGAVIATRSKVANIVAGAIEQLE